MSTFIFLHGSFHAAWNWHRTTPLLEARGHRAIAMDLPAHGQDRRSSARTFLSTCVDAVLRQVDAADAPVTLVAHSRNGIVISQAAEQRPDRIRGLVYLAAYLVPNGRSMMDYALQDDDSLVVQNAGGSVPRSQLRWLVRHLRSERRQRLLARLLPASMQVHRLRKSVYREALYHDCGDEITALANALLEAEPNWPGFTALQLSEQRWGRVPRVYIRCDQDRAVTPWLQQQMLTETPCDHVYSLNCSHSPFFSQPQALVDQVLDADSHFDAVLASRAAEP